MNAKIVKVITDQIMTNLDDALPWHMPWRDKAVNYATGNIYRGINQVVLGLVSNKRKVRNQWITYKQAQEKGLQVSGAANGKGVPVVFHVWDEDETGMKTVYKGARYFTVFSVDYLTEPPDPEVENANEVLQVPQTIIDKMIDPVPVDFGGDRACFYPALDRISLPHLKMFDTSEHYYATYFHELGHSTGVPKRLNRYELNKYDQSEYAQEELVAEFCSAFLMAECGLTNTVNNSKSYIKSWNAALKKHPDALLRGIADGQKAADYILRSA